MSAERRMNMPWVDEWDEEVEPEPSVDDIIADGEIGCRNCGGTFFRPVDPDGTVGECEDCGDGQCNISDYLGAARQD